ncbi:MAG TPA: Ig-like domain-containing protein [Pyrinomonadaceae bacterium]
MPLASVMAREAGLARSNLSDSAIRPAPDSTRRAANPFKLLSPPNAVITATKTDSFPDPNSDGQAEPGDTITYNVNVNNTGATDANGVAFNDTIDPNTTFVAGSLKVSPLAFADSYNATKDVALSIAAPGALANDTGTPSPTAQPISGGSTAQGGTVTLNADGSFNYTPPAGFEGADTFNYTVTNGQSPDDTATVTINVDAGPVVVNTTPANGATSVPTNANITVSFSEPVNATASSFSIDCPTGSPQAFALSASPSNLFTLDPAADLPAGTTCTVTVFASQITDADTNDPPDNLASNYVFSFGVQPLAVDDMRSATGNVRINTAASGFSVLTNDLGPGASITAFDAASAHGGNVQMNTATGTFTYNPPRGFTGTDSFNYTISNAAGSDQGTVVITVSDMVWFINDTPGACASDCDGRLTNPFTSLTAFEAINGNGATSGGAVIDPEAGDNIFLYTGTSDYNGPLTLENAQRVIGQGATASIESIAGITLAPDSDPLPPTGGAKPVITSSANGINLAQNNGLFGFALSNTTATAISGPANVGSYLMSDVDISNSATGGAGLSLTGGGTAAATGINNINTNTATALEVQNTNIDALGFIFRSISATGSSSNAGIILNNTGASGGLTVTGNGSANSGGTISNKTGADVTAGSPAAPTGATGGAGIFLSNTANVSLTSMHLQNFSNFAILGSNVAGFTLASSTINGANGDNPAVDDASVAFYGLTGSASITATSIQGGIEDNLRVINSAGSLNRITFDNFTLGANDSTFGDNGVLLQARNSAVINATVQNSFFNSARGDIFQIDLTNNAQSDLVFQNNTVNNQHPTIVTGGGGVTLSGGGSLASNVSLTYDINGNSFRGARGDALLILLQVGGGSYAGKVRNNTFGLAAVDQSGSREANDIEIRTVGSGNQTALVDSNQIFQYGNNGLLMQVGGQLASGNGSTGSMQATVTNNTISNPSSFAFTKNGIQLNSGANSGDAFNNCMDIRNNTVGGSGTIADINLRQRMITTVRLPGYGGANNNNAAVVSFIQGQNTGPESVTATNTVSTGGGGFVGGAACAQVAMLTTNQPDTLAWMNPLRWLTGRSQETSAAKSTETASAAFTAHYDRRAAVSADKRATQPASSALNASLLKKENERDARDTFASRKADNALLNNHSRTSRASSIALALLPPPANINATVGTLPAGKSVTISFQVTVNNPFGGTNQVSNQGTVSGDNFSDVPTDDPSVGGSADPTVTPILTPPDISIRDASASEPSTGSAPAAFAVVLSHAYSQPVTVSYATANDTGGANPATAGADYTAASGSLTFNPGETLQTISVPVLADANNAETDETFLVNLTGTNVGTINDSQAVGTITATSAAGTVVISELRTSGPAGSDDDFVELLNNTDSDITVQASDSSAGWSLVKTGNDCSATPVVVAVIPNGALIPARGNYLLVGSAYSLGSYATGDQTLTANIEDDHNVALFNTADLSNFQSATRLDAVGFGANAGNNCDLLREGATLQPASASTSEYSFVRQVDKGETKDTNDNAADFVVVTTTPASPVGGNTTPLLGAPGPENSASPRGPVPCSSASGTAKIERARLDASQGVGVAPNLVRDTTSDPLNNSAYGTLDFRRRFTNNSGGSVTRLRFRVVDMTTTPAAPGAADLRARASSAVNVSGVNDTATCGGSAPCSVLVNGTTLEMPPAQTLGGGVNSSLAVGTITLATPLSSGASVNLRFLFGVQQEGDYHIGIVIETLTTGSLGKDIWELRGNTQTGGHTDGDCNTPPVANAGADQTVECSGGSTNVTLDGSASTDPDGDTPLSYEWREGATVLGTGVSINTAVAFGSHTITLKVTDPSGAFGEDTLVVNVVDTTDPSITAPPNVNVSTGPGATTCGAFVSNAALGNATASDGCSASVTVTRTGVPAGNVFPVGTTIVTYTADDGHGHTRSAMQTVTVTDNTAPTLNVPADITVNAPPNSCSANVNPGTATGNDNCPGVTITGTRSDSQPLNAPYPVGTTTITWKAKDASNNTTTGSQTIKVKDAQAPVIVLSSGTLTLGPPNHSYHTFTLANLVASVSDLCDGGVDINDVVISQVTSDEIENGNGDGNTLNDIVIAPDCKSVQLRAEREGGGDGRVYKITLKVKDSSGNITTAVRQVIVPKSGSSATDSGAHYTVNGCNP